MIKIIDGKQEGLFLSRRDYYQGKSLLAKITMPITKRLRAYYAGKYIGAKESHLDIGCGDGYFMKRSKCRHIYGLDLKYGDFFRDKLDFPDNYFDYVTMLAVIEHLDFPLSIIRECHRILKDDGILVITTPKAKGLWIIRLYAPHFEEIQSRHKQYFDYQKMHRMLKGCFSVCVYRTFEFGFNQLFVCKKVNLE